MISERRLKIATRPELKFRMPQAPVTPHGLQPLSTEETQVELSAVTRERDQLLQRRNTDEASRSKKFRKIAENLGRVAQLTEEAQTEVSKLPEPSLVDTKAKVTMQLDEVMSRACSFNDFVTHNRSTMLDVP